MGTKTVILADARKTTIVNTGGAIDYDLPQDMTICTIAITQQGDNTTDASTIAERLAGIGNIEVITKEGGEIYISAFDLYHMTGYIERESTGVDLGGSAADKEMSTTVYVQMSLTVDQWFDRNDVLYGLPGNLAKKLRVTWGTDTVAGMDSRQATIQCFGYTGKKPSHYMVYRQDAFTSVAGQRRNQSVEGAGKLRGLFGFTTTNMNVDQAALVLGTDLVEIRVNDVPKMEALTIGLQKNAQGISVTDPAAQVGVLADEFWLWNLDPANKGDGYPIVNNMKTVCVGGTAEVVRVYPLIYRKASK